MPVEIGRSKRKARRKLLRLLERSQLEELSVRETPWHADRATLESDLMTLWPAEDIEEWVRKVIEAAR